MTDKRTGIRAMKRGVLAVFLLLTASSASQAGPLGVGLDAFPTILAGSITSRYDFLTGAFTASGLALTLNKDGSGQVSITTGFKLEATIDEAGNATNGSLIIGAAATPLLRSFNLLEFAFNPVQGGALEFNFGSPDGSYVPGTYSGTEPIDVTITVGNTFLGSFGSSWYSTSNTAQVRELPNPEPATLLLILAGATGLSLRRRKKRGVSV